MSSKYIDPSIESFVILGNNPNIDNASVLFPDPLSPTIAIVSPLFIDKFIPFTAFITMLLIYNLTALQHCII